MAFSMSSYFNAQETRGLKHALNLIDTPRVTRTKTLITPS